ncbi:MAG: type III secretion system chaperone [Candidatus Competibacteraceae bacterium]|nr:type III secretion system chaperone [Candidatus Competibacteraceae bacterium]
MNNNQYNVRDRAAQLLNGLSQGLGVDLKLDRDGACFFEHKDGWRMAILVPNEEQIVTAISVLSNVNAPDEAIWPALVEYGWIGAQTEGAALSWNPESRSFILWHSRDFLTTNAAELNILLLRLCKGAAMIRQSLSESIFSKPTASDEEPLPTNLFLHRV